MDVKEPDFEFLPPARVRLRAGPSGRLRLTLLGDRSYLEVKVVWAFPLYERDKYIGVLDTKAGNRVIGLIADPKELDAASTQSLMRSLASHYFVPTITRICSLKEEFGAVYCDVETDRGRRQFVAKGIRDATEELGKGELLIADVDGNRYRIADWRELDAQSRRFLERIV